MILGTRAQLARPVTTVVLCFLVTVLEGVDIQAAGAVGPRLLAQYGLSGSTASLMFAAGPLGLFLGALWGGALGDRLGRKTVLTGSVLVFGAFALITAFAWNAPSLILMRLLTGIGLGGAMPNLIAMTAEASPPRWKRALTTALWVGTPLGGLMAAQIAARVEDWRAVFHVGGVGPLLLAPLLLWLLPNLPRTRAKTTPTEGLTRTLFADGRLYGTLLLWIGFFFTLLLLHLFLNWLPLLVLDLGLPKSAAAAAAIWFNLGGCTGALALAFLVAWIRPGVLLLGVYGALAASLLGLSGLGSAPENLAPLAFAAGVFINGAPFLLYGLAPELYAAPVRGAGVGAAVAAGRVGSVAGPAVVGVLMTAGLSASNLFLTALPLALVAGACVSMRFWRAHSAPSET